MGTALDILKDFPPTTPAQWLAAVEKELKGKPFDKTLVKKTYEGIDIQPMYFVHDLDGLPLVDTLPGQVPYLRGTSASGNKGNAWRIAQEITLADPGEFNRAPGTIVPGARTASILSWIRPRGTDGIRNRLRWNRSGCRFPPSVTPKPPSPASI